ncbi:MAG TPA: DUF6084 family protein [Conexibacter sp.]|jgi:hypothetical protein|nr:DUF6084 family protein [Conexibacter sp.]
MTAVSPPDATPTLDFAVASIEALRPSATPTLRFTLALDAGEAAVRSVLLDVQVQIAATRRRYDAAEQAQLADLFGAPERWGETLRTLPWLRASVVVPPFAGATTAQLDIPCTYDFEVSAARYLAGLRDGEVPLELLLSGTVFHGAGGGAMQVSRIGWDRELTCRLPVATWRAALDQHFPGAAWLRLDRPAFDRLAAYRAQRALPSWEAVVEELLVQEDAAR